MATTQAPQRAWRAACPNCGAQVEFASAASPIAVCSFCRSTLARDGETLRRIGQSAELFEDHSPLQLGASGRWQGAAFTLVGRLQMRYADGVWNEWHALFDGAAADGVADRNSGVDAGSTPGGPTGGKSGWLSEDNGRYVMAFDAPAPQPLPAPESLQPGAGVALDARLWQVASITRARVAAAQGELPYAPNLADDFTVVDLRNTQGEVGTLDYGDAKRVRWSVGRSAPLSELALRGLREESEKAIKARGIECPSCGTALEIRLDTTQSIVCYQCKAVVDVSKGVGGDLAHYAQGVSATWAVAPRIPLGSTGTLALGAAARPWQVVGYVQRRSIPEDPEDDAESWHEYLLYSREVGFSFLVDAEDGWSWATPITGAPQLRGDAAQWGGATYRKLYAYGGEITYVLGEFYWRLQRGERTANVDYGVGNKRLNREQSGQEVTWSAGETIDAAKVAQAFALPGLAGAALAREASPLSSGGMSLATKIFIGIFVLMLIISILQSNSDDGCAEIGKTFGSASVEYQQCMNSGGGVARIPRTGGGSFGGFGGGGGHK